MNRRQTRYRKNNNFDRILNDNKILFIVIVVIIFVIIRLFVPIFSRKHEIEKRKKHVDTQITTLNNQIVEMTEEVERLEDDKVYIEKIAREQLGLARKGEIVYNIVAQGKESVISNQ